MLRSAFLSTVFCLVPTMNFFITGFKKFLCRSFAVRFLSSSEYSSPFFFCFWCRVLKCHFDDFGFWFLVYRIFEINRLFFFFISVFCDLFIQNLEVSPLSFVEDLILEDESLL